MAAAKRKKRFFNIEMPLIKKTTQLQAFEVKDLDGKYIKYDLTRLFKGKSMLITFKTVLEEDEVHTKPKELRLMPYYLRRMVRRGTNYVEDSFSTNSKDAQIRLKPFLVTRRKVSRAVRKNLRNTAKEFIIEYIKEKDYNTICNELLDGILQKAMLPKLKKVYPLSFCDIRIFETKELEKIDMEKASEMQEADKESADIQASNEENIQEETEEIKEETESNPIEEETPEKKE